jgi:hypothetical protein
MRPKLVLLVTDDTEVAARLRLGFQRVGLAVSHSLCVAGGVERLMRVGWPPSLLAADADADAGELLPLLQIVCAETMRPLPPAVLWTRDSDLEALERRASMAGLEAHALPRPVDEEAVVALAFAWTRESYPQPARCCDMLRANRRCGAHRMRRLGRMAF